MLTATAKPGITLQKLRPAAVQHVAAKPNQQSDITYGMTDHTTAAQTSTTLFPDFTVLGLTTLHILNHTLGNTFIFSLKLNDVFCTNLTWFFPLCELLPRHPTSLGSEYASCNTFHELTGMSKLKRRWRKSRTMTNNKTVLALGLAVFPRFQSLC